MSEDLHNHQVRESTSLDSDAAITCEIVAPRGITQQRIILVNRGLTRKLKQLFKVRCVISMLTADLAAYILDSLKRQASGSYDAITWTSKDSESIARRLPGVVRVHCETCYAQTDSNDQS